MCYFISIAVRENHQTTLKSRLRSSFKLSESDNQSIKNSLNEGETLFVLSDGHCACDLYSAPTKDPRENTEEKLRAKYSKPKYKKLGWTKEKIGRAIADSLAKPVSTFSELREDLRWQLSDLVRDVGPVQLLVHFYAGDVEQESVEIRSKSTITCKQLMERDELITEDSLIQIKPGHGN